MGHRTYDNEFKREAIRLAEKAKAEGQSISSVADNLLEQNFVTDKPNQVWTSDITYIRTDEGWLYLCVILDLFSRQIAGWAMDKRMKKRAGFISIKAGCWTQRPWRRNNYSFRSRRAICISCCSKFSS